MGMEDMRNFVKRSQGEFEVDFTKMGMGMMLETWWWPLTIEGRGTWQFDFREAKRDMLFIECTNLRSRKPWVTTVPSFVISTRIVFGRL